MHAIVLAAGYARRLSPLTDNCPKALLPVRGVPLLDYVMAKVFAVPGIEAVTLVSNHRFIAHFENWLRWRRPPAPVRLLDDGTLTNETRLGGIGDLLLAVERHDVRDDALVLASDNLFAADLAQMVAFARERRGDCVIVRGLDDLKARQRTGIAVLDADSRLVEFQEKPQQPKTNLAVPPIYVYRSESLRLLGEYLDGGNNPDSPGHFLGWLCARQPVFGWRCDGEIWDIGNLEQYAQAQEKFDAARESAFGIRSW